MYQQTLGACKHRVVKVPLINSNIANRLAFCLESSAAK